MFVLATKEETPVDLHYDIWKQIILNELCDDDIGRFRCDAHEMIDTFCAYLRGIKE